MLAAAATPINISNKTNISSTINLMATVTTTQRKANKVCYREHRDN